MLRVRTWLVPGIPRAVFEVAAEALQEALQEAVELSVDAATSGPMRPQDDVFAEGEVDLGFSCGPAYLWLSGRTPPSVVLVDAAPLFEDPRAAGRAVYFIDAIVAADAPYQALPDLAGASWVYNDRTSFSGLYSVLGRLEALGLAPDHFAEIRCVGGHAAAIAEVARGSATMAAIDGNILRRLAREDPDLRARVRVLESWGPAPVMPTVLRRALAPRAPAIAQALRTAHEDPSRAQRLAAAGVLRFVGAESERWEAQRPRLARLHEVAVASGLALPAPPRLTADAN